ncbi:hypothetical protein, partial [Ileibacterium valens]|uniref:hypothetical protein n=1 Tax=Ileibacterium valens TaxID=1862668 RepID=UPI00272C9A33
KKKKKKNKKIKKIKKIHTSQKITINTTERNSARKETERSKLQLNFQTCLVILTTIQLKIKFIGLPLR